MLRGVSGFLLVPSDVSTDVQIIVSLIGGTVGRGSLKGTTFGEGEKRATVKIRDILVRFDGLLTHSNMIHKSVKRAIMNELELPNGCRDSLFLVDPSRNDDNSEDGIDAYELSEDGIEEEVDVVESSEDEV